MCQLEGALSNGLEQARVKPLNLRPHFEKVRPVRLELAHWGDSLVLIKRLEIFSLSDRILDIWKRPHDKKKVTG